MLGGGVRLLYYRQETLGGFLAEELTIYIRQHSERLFECLGGLN
jgi:hypothetical protein